MIDHLSVFILYSRDVWRQLTPFFSLFYYNFYSNPEVYKVLECRNLTWGVLDSNLRIFSFAVEMLQTLPVAEEDGK